MKIKILKFVSEILFLNQMKETRVA